METLNNKTGVKVQAGVVNTGKQFEQQNTSSSNPKDISEDRGNKGCKCGINQK